MLWGVAEKKNESKQVVSERQCTCSSQQRREVATKLHRFTQQLKTASLQEVWEGGKTPESWRISRLTCLWERKDSPLKPAKHTALSIIALLNKLIIIIGLDRMRKVYEHNQPDTQLRFRNGVSTQDAIYVAKRLTDTIPGTWTACFINLRTGFDHIWGSCRGASLWFSLSNTVRNFRGLVFKWAWTWRDWGIPKLQASKFTYR